ncbi:34020_t:CDS:1, partial [Racocetra persica]
HGDSDSTTSNGQTTSTASTSSGLNVHRSRSTNFVHSTDNIARSTNREATPTTVTAGAGSESGSVLVS